MIAFEQNDLALALPLLALTQQQHPWLLEDPVAQLAASTSGEKKVDCILQQ
jgi:hypothetical protein